MARGKQVIQLLKAITLVARPQGATIEELEEELGVSRRSVYREIRVIEDLGFPLEEATADVQNRKRHKLMDRYVKKLPNISVPRLELDLEELIAINMLRGDSALYAGTEVASAIDRAYKKLGSFLPEATVEKLERLGTLFVSGSRLTKDYSEKDDIIAELTAAMLKLQRCRITYHSFTDDQEKKFRIDPLHFYEMNGGLYLFANIPRFENVRTLAIERIIQVEPIDESFKIPENFHAKERIDSAFQITYDDPLEVDIRFSPRVAKYIRERRWSPDQKLTSEPDGSVVLSMATSGRKEVLMWVLSFGSDATVISPEGMRAQVAEEARRVAAAYA